MPKGNFKKILIANRGEIALRIIRTCKELGIQTVAVYSEPDRKSLHVAHADEAFCLGEAALEESYLNIQKIVEIAKKSNAEAIHPGYGFLSENPELAKAASNASLAFIGPAAETLTLLGNKVEARRLGEKLGIPLIPGSGKGIENIQEAQLLAEKLGYPVLIKAAAGGGGHGMRIVYHGKELSFAIDAAKRESLKAFGSSEIYLEKYLTHPRHIEFQLLADKKGNLVHLFERECSVQRRYQKIMEETPSPALDDKKRKAMGEAVITLAKAAHYEGAGTVEFMLDEKGNFYFLEVNPRIQVEHPITELCTGVDLVRVQIQIAAGKQLPFSQKDILPLGAAIECRIYAEDPFEGFIPSPGTIRNLRLPAGPHVRVDSALYEGWEIPLYYDPLLAKISCWARTRGEAISRMKSALKETLISGMKTTIPIELEVLENKAFASGKYDTNLVDHILREEKAPFSNEDFEMAAMAAALFAYQSARGEKGAAPLGPSSAWKEMARRVGLRSGLIHEGRKR